MKKITLYLLLSLFTFAAAAADNPSDAKRSLVKDIRTQLASVHTPKDSITILYNAFDAASRADQIKIAREMYPVAQRAGDVKTQLDLCRQVTSAYGSDSAINIIKAEVKKLPDSKEKKETLLFLDMKPITKRVRRISEPQRIKEVSALISKLDSKKNNDIYSQIFTLFSIVEYLRNDASGDMLKQYLDRLVELVNKPEVELYVLKNIVYAEAALIYTDAQDYARGVAADRKLLQIIDDLEKQYKDEGRIHRNYDINRYICYRRMIRNYKALRPGEADFYYNEALKLAATSPEVKSDIEKFPRIHAYYHMAKGNYKEAIPAIKKMLAIDQTATVKRQALEMLIEAANNTGDDKTKLEALSEYNIMLDQFNKLRAAEKYKEMQIKYDIADLRERNAALELANREKEIKSARTVMSFVIVAFVILAIAFIIMIYYWSQMKKNSNSMGEIVDNLAHERDRIRNTQFFDYATSHYPIDSEDRFEDWALRMKRDKRSTFETSTFMTQSIINDLLFIAAIGRNDRQKYIVETSVDAIMREAQCDARQDLNADSNVVVEFPENDFNIVTDSDCLRYMIKHVIVASSKFSESGTTTLASERLDDGSVSFSITVSDPRPSDGDGAHFFDSFVTTERLRNKADWGLFFCRLVDMGLACKLVPDYSYNGASRFLLIVPANLTLCD